MRKVLLRWLINGIAVWAAIQVVPGITAEGDWVAIALIALILGLVNAFIKPFLTLLSCPLMVLTLGLFTLVVNGLVLSITSWLAVRLNLAFNVNGFWPAFLGGLVISIVSLILSIFFADDERNERRGRKRS